MINVAIFPCGSEAGLEVHNALQHEKNIRLFGASGVRCHGEAVFKDYDCSIPFINSPHFEDALNAYLVRNDIDYLFPAYDDAIVTLAKMGERLKTKAVIPSAEICKIARLKSATYKALEGLPFCPAFTTNADEVDKLPVFAKPDQGQGSQGISLIKTSEDLAKAAVVDHGLVFCENLSGPEYTVDCFTDRHGKLHVCAPRVRQRVKSGISVRTASLKANPKFREIAEQILERIPFQGVWFFQLKEDTEGSFKLLEVAPRVAGSMAATRACGSNLPLMALYDLQGYDVSAIDNEQPVTLERYLGNRYVQIADFETVYIDFDDTITYQNRLNIEAMRFMYHCLNNGKQLILITRHAKDIHETLNHYKIAPEMFAQVIHIKDESAKSSHIDPKNAIFIDDSFAERMDVHNCHGISVYGVDAVESLIDWRQK